jgi:hypothetical protein
MLKYIKMTASSNFGNVFSVLVASAFMPFLPMLPMHLLVQNLLYDISQMAFPSTTWTRSCCASPALEPGRHRALHAVLRPDQLDLRHHHLPVMWFVFGANTPEHQTCSSPAGSSRAAVADADRAHDPHPQDPLRAEPSGGPADDATGLIMALGIFIPMGPLAHYFKLQALPWPTSPSWRRSCWLHGADPGHEGLLQPALRLAVVPKGDAAAAATLEITTVILQSQPRPIITRPILGCSCRRARRKTALHRTAPS